MSIRKVAIIVLFSGAAVGERGLGTDDVVAWVDTDRARLQMVPSPQGTKFQMTVAEFGVSLARGDKCVQGVLSAWNAAPRKVLTTSSPCADFSTAGVRDSRWPVSGVWNELFEVLDVLAPTFLVVENVIGALQDHKKPGDRCSFGKEFVVEMLRRQYDVAWRTICPSSFGLPHRRPRVFFICSPAGLLQVEKVLLNSEASDAYRKRASKAAGQLAGAPKGWRDLSSAYSSSSSFLVRKGRDGKPVCSKFMTGMTSSGVRQPVYLRVQGEGSSRTRGGKRRWFRVGLGGLQRLWGLKDELMYRDERRRPQKIESEKATALSLGSHCDVWKWLKGRIEGDIARGETMNGRRVQLRSNVGLTFKHKNLPEAGFASVSDGKWTIRKAEVSPFPVWLERLSLEDVLLEDPKDTTIVQEVSDGGEVKMLDNWFKNCREENEDE